MGRILGRDPAAFVAQVVSAVVALIVILPLTQVLTAALSAVTIAIGGLVVAFAVAKDGQVAAIVGLGRAVIALGVVLGLPWTEPYQAAVLVALEQVAGLFLYTQVTARLDRNLQPVAPAPRP